MRRSVLLADGTSHLADLHVAAGLPRAGREPEAGQPGWSAADFAAMGAFMEPFTKDLAESGELVDTRGPTAPVHARRIRLRDGVPVVTDGSYPESEEVGIVPSRRRRCLAPSESGRLAGSTGRSTSARSAAPESIFNEVLN